MKSKFILSITLFSLFFSCKKEEFKSKSTQENPSKKNTNSTQEIVTNLEQNNSTKNNYLLSNLYQKVSKKPQQFVINTQKDTTIICTEKTKLKINANSFISATTGKAIDGKVQIQVTEYYSISDIVLANLSTSSDGKLLETGGMIHISAISDGKKCVIKKGKSIEIGLPTKAKKDDMQLFSGKWEDNSINWKVDQSASKSDANPIGSIEVKPIFPGGDKALYKLISESIFNEEDVAGKLIFNFEIDKEGKAGNTKIIRKLHPFIDKQIGKIIERLPKFIPAQIDGKAVKSNYTITLIFESSGNDTSTERTEEYKQKFKANFEEKYDSNTIEDASINEISYYYFVTSNLGLINCDRFIQTDPSLLINFSVDLENESEAVVNIVFKKYKSVLQVRSADKTATFKKIPKNMEVTVVALKYYNDKPYLATKETTTATRIETGLVFEPISMEKLKAEIKKLD